MSQSRRGRIYQWFAHPWQAVPAQGALFAFLFIAGVHVIVTPNNTSIGFEAAGLSTATYMWWNILILSSPVMVAASYLLIKYGLGYARLTGFWLRLGGDLGMTAALAVIIATRAAVLSPIGVGDSPLFSMVTLTGLTMWCAMLVVRDIGAIITLERLANRIHYATREQ